MAALERWLAPDGAGLELRVDDSGIVLGDAPCPPEDYDVVAARPRLARAVAASRELAGVDFDVLVPALADELAALEGPAVLAERLGRLANLIATRRALLHAWGGAMAPIRGVTDGLAIPDEARLVVLVGDAAAARDWIARADLAPSVLRFRLDGLPEARSTRALTKSLADLAEIAGRRVLVALEPPVLDRRWPAVAAALLARPELRVVVTLSPLEARTSAAPAAPRHVLLLPAPTGDLAQLERLPADERGLVGLISVAGLLGARLDRRQLAGHLDLPAPVSTLRSLERRGLVRRMPRGLRGEWLAPTGAAFAEAVVARLYTTETLGAALAGMIPLVDEVELEAVLIGALQRFPECAKPVLDRLATMRPASHLGAAAVLRALLWLGAREAAESKLDAARDAYARAGRAFHREGTWLDDEAATRARAYLAALPELMAPNTAAEWRGFSEITFWSGRLAARSPACTITSAALGRAVGTLDLDSLGQLVLALFDGHDTRALEWIRQVRGSLTVRVHELPGLVGISDESQRAELHLVLTEENRDAAARSAIECVRRILPDRVRYAARVYGAGAEGEILHDLEVGSMGAPWPLVRLGRFVHLVERALRPADEGAFQAALAATRERALGRLRLLARTFQDQAGRPTLETLGSPEEWLTEALAIERPPLRPETECDPRGTAGDGFDTFDEADGSQAEARLHPPDDALVATARYLRATSSFLTGVLAVVAHRTPRRGSGGVRDRARAALRAHGLSADGATASRALSDALAALADLARARPEDALTPRERTALEELLLPWHRFAHEPRQRKPSTSPETVDARWDALRKRFETGLAVRAVPGVRSTLRRGEAQTPAGHALLIELDAEAAAAVPAALGRVTAALREALDGEPVWRSLLAARAQRIHIAPLVGGRVLGDVAWSLSPLRDGASAAPQPTPPLAEPKGPPSLRRAALIEDTARELEAAVRHLASLHKLPEGVEADALQAVFGTVSARIGDLLEALTGRVVGLLREIEGMPPGEQVRHEALLAAGRRLADFYRASVPETDGGLTLGEVARWSSRITGALGHVEAFRVLYVADALGLPM